MKVTFDTDISGLQRFHVGNLIRGLADWSWWGTLTFARTVPEDAARRALRKWLRDIAQRLVDCHFKVAYTLEAANGNWHIHFVFDVPTRDPAVNSKALDALWKKDGGGFTDISRYRPSTSNADASDYIAKTNGWDIITVCPRRSACRRKFCKVARTSW